MSDTAKLAKKIASLEARVRKLEVPRRVQPKQRKPEIWYVRENERGPARHKHIWAGPGYHGSSKDEYWCIVTFCSAHTMDPWPQRNT